MEEISATANKLVYLAENLKNELMQQNLEVEITKQGKIRK